MKISFIVGTFNRPHKLRYCLASIQSQDDFDFECLVMDEGNNEHVVDALNDSRFKRYPVERVWVEPRGTLGLSAKDKGVEFATCEYIVFPSEDAFYMPKFLTAVKEEILRTDSDVVYTDFMHEYNDYENKIEAKPMVGSMDIANFAMRRKTYEENRFTNYFDADIIGTADGRCVVDAVTKGATHSRIPFVLCLHC